MRPRKAFTLVELLVVVFIVILVSVVALPTVIPALNNRQVDEAARILQAALAGARDLAIRNNATAGIRLVPDDSIAGALVANRIVSIEPAPDINEGRVTFPNKAVFGNTFGLAASWQDSSGNPTVPPAWPFPFNTAGNGSYPYPFVPAAAPGGPPPPPQFKVLLVEQVRFNNNYADGGPAAATNWWWSVRVGDRFRFEGAGRFYTVVGPMTVPNPEFFVNDGLPGNLLTSLAEQYIDSGGTLTTPVTDRPEFLFLVNGVDDDNDGYIDNGFNGVDENLNGVADDIAEWVSAPSLEVETWLGSQGSQSHNYQPAQGPGGATGKAPVLPTFAYTITRRPVPSPGAQEVALPSGAVIDLTTWNNTRERSRLPVDPNTRYVDVLLNQSGQVVPTTTYSNPASVSMDQSFYHFWVASRDDVMGDFGQGVSPKLPIPLPPSGTPYALAVNGVSLRKDRRLVTLFARTGQVVTNSIEVFDFANAYQTSGTPPVPLYDANVPFDQAQLGTREAK